MFAKILTVTALVAYAQAGVFDLPQQHQLASSYSSINSHLSPVAQYAAPALLKTAQVAPVAAYHSAPIAYRSAPVAAYHSSPVATYHAAPVVKAIHQELYADAHPQYSYQYGVQDAHSGDIKNQHEERDGDVVKGVYSLVQPDGVTRTVHYSADHHNGFNAQVEYTGHAAHPQVVQKAVVAKTLVAAAPVYQAYHH